MGFTANDIRIELTKNPKPKPQDVSKLGFGKYYTDHMFILDYKTGKGWHDPRIIPYAPLSLDPAAMCLHYAQEVFEGMKAYRTPQGKAVLFRPEKNMERLNLSNSRLCIPEIDEQFAVLAVRELVRIDQDWIPQGKDTSLYIRPFIIATEAQVGVKPADEYKFIVILSPVGAYYAEGLNPVRIYVEREFVRSVKGGMGYTKTGGNYAASIKAQEKAHAQGYSQVLWLDGVHRKYIEEVGTMNIFFKIGGQIFTPELSGSVLGGITRLSCIQLLRDWGYTVTERLISIDEIEQAAADGSLEEVFGTGTAAVISPVGQLKSGENDLVIGSGQTGEVAARLYDTLTGIQNGRIADPQGWVVEI